MAFLDLTLKLAKGSKILGDVNGCQVLLVAFHQVVHYTVDDLQHRGEYLVMWAIALRGMSEDVLNILYCIWQQRHTFLCKHLN